MKTEEYIRKADMIFAVGGGKAIDTCKVLSEQLKKPLFTFLTIASTCASITSVCAMYNKDGSFRDLFWKSTPPNHVFIENHLHGELVSYGVLVQLMLDKNVQEIEKLLSFYKVIDLPISYKNFGVTEEQMKKVVEAASEVNDVRVAPFKITEELLYDAVTNLENMI